MSPWIQRTLRLWGAVYLIVVLAGFGTAASAALAPVPAPLSGVTVPEPDNLYEFVKSKKWAIILGKAFFWDMQTGSDGIQACASCHFNAGADVRIKNTLNPGLNGVFGWENVRADRPCERIPTGANYQLTGGNVVGIPSEFPLSKAFGATNQCDTDDNVGSQGVVGHTFIAISKKGDVDLGIESADDTPFHSNGFNTRRVTGKNTPTMINAVFNMRNLWNGRAMPNFNGQTTFGSVDTAPFVVKRHHGKLVETSVMINNASLASQAVGPPLDSNEMSWETRRFPDLARKLLHLRPLGKQKISKHDSVLGPYANRLKGYKGLKFTHTYRKLIKRAFKNKWWGGSFFARVCVPKPGVAGTPYVDKKGKCGSYDAFTQMEFNFALFWGLAIQLYEATLVSDQTPFDICAATAGTDEAKLACLDSLDTAGAGWRAGLEVFLTEGVPADPNANPPVQRVIGGTCFGCHRGPMLSGASIMDIQDKGGLAGKLPLIPANNPGGEDVGLYDLGFANVGVALTDHDPGIGGFFPGTTIPLSFSGGLTTSKFPPLDETTIICDENAPNAPGGIHDGLDCFKSPEMDVDLAMSPGAFKTPGLRNRLFTGPHFHNGDADNLGGVVGFYRGQGNGNPTKDPRLEKIVMPFGPGGGGPAAADLIAFLEGALVDPRVQFQKAPFDHPELCVPHGHDDITGETILKHVEATGEYGSDKPLVTFDEMLAGHNGQPEVLDGKANTLQENCPDYMLPQKYSKKHPKFPKFPGFGGLGNHGIPN